MDDATIRAKLREVGVSIDNIMMFFLEYTIEYQTIDNIKDIDSFKFYLKDVTDVHRWYLTDEIFQSLMNDWGIKERYDRVCNELVGRDISLRSIEFRVIRDSLLIDIDSNIKIYHNTVMQGVIERDINELKYQIKELENQMDELDSLNNGFKNKFKNISKLIKRRKK